MRDSIATWQQVDTALSRLLVIEAEIGLTFTQAANAANSTGECLHNRRLARQAYDNARNWMRRARLDDTDAKALCSKLELLGNELCRLGDPVGKSCRSGKPA
ncbi:hypothetical protein [Alloacidobacterium sp.]|uniref:hypothetical protein n=1 Tax=Alloacidobacterium sp. TaxID=2951999 RepID=UPI002D2DB2D6|nr:hypothetical protein [Alloacidobacterium sp.]HYK37593.1 hypothetical protein [Alloacidobacterium sp.]